METTKTTRVMSKWRVSSNGWGEDKTYQVYRRIDVNATDHSGNRENRGGVFDSKAEAQAYADKLNAGIDPEAEEEARYLNATADIFAELETVSFRSNVMETGADWGEFLDAATESTT